MESHTATVGARVGAMTGLFVGGGIVGMGVGGGTVGDGVGAKTGDVVGTAPREPHVDPKAPLLRYTLTCCGIAARGISEVAFEWHEPTGL